MEHFRDHSLINFLILAALVSLFEYSLAQGISRNCGGLLSESSGTIESPNYPSPYPAELVCTWFVSVEDTVVDIKVSFSAFDLPPKSGGQCRDNVAIHSLLLTKDTGATLEGTFCGGAIPVSMRIAESSFTVQFFSYSDGDPENYNSHTGFSLHYEANLDHNSNVTQTTAGIVAGIFCAVIFIGVGMLRCFMTGMCLNNNCCNQQNEYAERRTHQREVVGTDESYTFQADFPPSYSTVMNHPDRFPTPETSPAFMEGNRIVATGSQMPGQNPSQRIFTLQSGDSESSDNEGETTLPPPYPGNLDYQHQVNGGIAHNAMTEPSNTENISPRVVADGRGLEEIQDSSNVPSTEGVVDNEIRPTYSTTTNDELSETTTVAPSSTLVIADNIRDQEII